MTFSDLELSFWFDLGYVTKRGIWWPSAGLSSLRREFDLFYGENCFEMHAVDPEILNSVGLFYALGVISMVCKKS